MMKIYIWIRTKSFLWGNNEEQPQITWEVTMSGTGSMLCACATGSFAKPLVGPFHRKWRQWPEVIVCACATGIFYITTRVVVQVHSYRRSGRVYAISPCGAFSPEVGYRKWPHFPRAFFLVVVHHVGWWCSLRRSRLPLSLVICPFIFIITYKVCCFRICCVVLQEWYF